jgi:hypothetical protein
MLNFYYIIYNKLLKIFRMTLKQISPILFLMLVFGCTCNREKKVANDKYKLNQPLISMATYDEGYPLTDEIVDKDAPYKAEDFVKYYSDFYKDKTTPPPFDFNMDISHKTFNELRLLRAEIFARHGFLFMDYVLRSQFNATKWYQPVFWYNDFKIKLSEEEKKFIDKVLQLEQELYKKNYVVFDGYKKANTENVVNWQQFENIPEEMMKHLKQDGFVINKAEYEQLFHVYDENYYDYTPSFITTDLYLQVLHMHISKEMQSLEEEKMIPILTELITEQFNTAKKTAESTKNPIIKKASEWNQVYYAVGLSLITDTKQEVPSEYLQYYQYEYEHTQEAQGLKSDFLGDSLMDYTQFQPRGNYTRTDSLKRYFKCVKWLNSASIYLDEDAGLNRAILMGNALLHSEASQKKYQTFSNIIKFLAGEENNLSIFHLMKILKEYNSKNVEELLSKENSEKIRSALYNADPRKMIPKGGNLRTEDFLARKKLLFTAGRYTFDGEILQRLVHIARPDLKIEPKRPFPKALDVFAAMGNNDAEDILLNVYKEKQVWEGYPDTLNILKRKFKGFNNWDLSIYNKKMEAILSLQKPNTSAPYFMQMPNWQKKNLNTMLASWTGLKHDMVLYIEQPSGAEMGDGGEIPPPQKIAYVEPQIEFWKKCIGLLDLNKKMLEENGLMTKKLEYRNKELLDMAGLFIRISDKELKGQKISNKEFDTLSFIGGQVESLTLNIIESHEGFVSQVTTPERYMAIATDVYTYNDKCLEEGVGMGDEIYIIAEINGLLYLTRGAVFSHYEFTQSTSERLTDEAWQKQLLDHKGPTQAVWMNDIKISVPRPKTAPNFNLY